MNVAKHWHVAGEVFAISDCLVMHCADLCHFVLYIEATLGKDALSTLTKNEIGNSTGLSN